MQAAESDLQKSTQGASKILKLHRNQKFSVHLPGTSTILKGFGLQNKLPELLFQAFLNTLDFNNIHITMYPENQALGSVLPTSQIQSPRLNHPDIHKANEVMQENLGKPHNVVSSQDI